MADRAIATEMTTGEKLDMAKNVLAELAVDFAANGFRVDKGQGTVNLDKNGILSIVGINDDKSANVFRLEPSRTVSGDSAKSEIIDRVSTYESKYVIQHKQSLDQSNPKNIGDELGTVDPTGKATFDLKGTCNISDNGSRDCTYKVSNNSAERGTVNIITSKLDEDSSKSIISMKTAGINMSFQLDYRTSGDVATYALKKL